MSTVGDRIRLARNEQHLTMEALAKKIGVTRASVSYWESGETKSLKSEHLHKLAKALQVSPDWILTGKDGKPLHVAEAQSLYTHSTDEDAQLFAEAVAEVDHALNLNFEPDDPVWEPLHRGRIYYNAFLIAKAHDGASIRDRLPPGELRKLIKDAS